jgi:hypothetical protein
MFNDLTTKEIATLYKESVAERLKQRKKEEEAKALQEIGAHTEDGHYIDSCGYVREGSRPTNTAHKRTVVDERGYVCEIGTDEKAPLTPRERLLENIQKLTPEEIAALAPDDSEATKKFREQYIDAVSEQFVAENPDYYVVEENADELVSYLSQKYLHRPTGEDDFNEHQNMLFSRGAWTVETLTEAYRSLLRQGRLKVRPGTARELTAEERRTISRMCSAIRTHDDANAAIDQYLRFALNRKALVSWQNFVDDPDYDEVIQRAIGFCWEQSRTDYTPTAERRAYLKQYLAGRFPSFDLLDSAWKNCQVAEQYAVAHTESTPTGQDLQKLYDENPEEFERLRVASLRQFFGNA